MEEESIVAYATDMSSVSEYVEYSDINTIDEEECEHEQTNDIDGSLLCLNCGLKINDMLMDNETNFYGANDTRYASDPSRHNQRKNDSRSLYYDLEPLNFPQEIIERANKYYQHIIKDKIYRAKNRLSIVFACTYHAYIDVGEPRQPSELAKIFKLSKKGISNGLKIFSKNFPKRPNKKYIDAMDIIPNYLSALNIEDERFNRCMEDISSIYDFIKSKNAVFNSSNPQSIAAGLVYFYLKYQGVNITRSTLSNIVKLTDITFIKIANDIHKTLDVPRDIKY